MNKIGCILAGGQGVRLRPITNYLNKHLIHIYNKPMIFYPLSNMLLCGIRKIYIVVNPEDLDNFKKLLKNFLDKNKGLKIHFLIQKKSDGIVDGLKLLKKFIKKNTKILTILGDNFILGTGLINNCFLRGIKNKKGCTFFSIYNNMPKKFGVIKYNNKKKISKIIEKPKKFISNDVVIGAYVFDEKILNYFDLVKISKNQQYEITDLINLYIKDNDYENIKLGRGTIWIDCGEFEQLYQASETVRFNLKNSGIDIGNIKNI
jgi:glucose-1-phosphate thymidylyltransferase